MPAEIVSPAARLDTLPTEIPKLTLGYEALRWQVKYLRQPNGPKAGQRYQPTPRQIHFLLHWYAVNEDGEWLYHHGVRRLAKASGKSPNAAAIALTELCAPVRLKDFDPKAPGGCVGKPVSMPLVQIAAVSEAQTENTMRMVRAFARKGTRVVTDHVLDPGLKIYHKADGGKLEVVTNSAASVEGAEASFIICDEVEHWFGNPGKNFAATLADNAAKSGSRLIETCNCWIPGSDSVAEDTFDTWVHQEELLTQGKSTKSGSLILYDARMAPPDTDMGDQDSLMSALQWVYEDTWWVDPKAIIKRIWHKSSRPDDSKRRFLNWPVAPEDAWVTPQQWQAIADPTRELVDGEDVCLFFDGSKSRDASALVGCALSDGHIFTLGTWEPNLSRKRKSDEDEDTAQIDMAEVDAVVSAAHERFNVRAFWSDVREVEGLAKLTWPERWRDSYSPKLWAVPGGAMPEPIAWDMRSHGRMFAFAAEQVEAEIREKAFTHDGNAVTERHVGNCRRTETRYGAITVRKETPNSPDKIDAAVCVIGARMLYRIALQHNQPDTEPAKAFFGSRWR